MSIYGSRLTPDPKMAHCVCIGVMMLAASMSCSDSSKDDPPDVQETSCLKDKDCDDGNACNGAERCDAAKGCVAGTAPECDDGDECNGKETCDTTDGCQSGKPLECGDGDACNGEEFCDAKSGCQSGEALKCDDGLPCTGEESCDPATGCVRGTPPEGCCENDDACDDENQCNGEESCDLSTNTCTIPEPMACDDKDPCNGEETCDPKMGCVSGETLECDDGDACNGKETCEKGEGCQAGDALVCDDNLPCNGVETCNKDTGCVPGTPPEGCCSSNDQCDDKNVCNGTEVCNPDTNTCDLGTALSCDDNDACNGKESCDAQKGCQAGTALECNDKKPCNGEETCAADKGCVDGTPLECNDKLLCTVDTCDDQGCQHKTTGKLPTITIDGVTDNGSLTGAVTAVVTIGGAPHSKTAIELDGKAFSIPGDPGDQVVESLGPINVPVSGEGKHTLKVTTQSCKDLPQSLEYTFTIDNTPPSIKAQVDPAPNDAGWNNTPVTVTFVANDDLSGVATVTEPTVVSKPGKDIVVKGTVTDAAGLSAETSVTLNLDFKAPVVTIDSPKPNQEGDDQLVVGSTQVTLAGVISDDTLSGFAGGLLTSSKTKAKIKFSVPKNYSETLELAQGINTVIVSASDVAGNTGTASMCIIVDTANPHVTIQYPPSGYKTTEESVDISGVAQDLVVGSISNEDVTVMVNGVKAKVDNAQFVATAVPLQLGNNNVTATATDSVGKVAKHSIEIQRQSTAVKHLKVVSGNNQQGPILTQLPDLLVVKLVDGAGDPIANEKVVFGVTSNDGTISHPAPVIKSPKDRSLVATTDDNGNVSVSLTLGSRAGTGINRVTASAEGALSSVSLFATGTAIEALNVHPHAGLNQIGTVGEPLPMPLSVVVTDAGNNPVAGQPVTFEVTKGNSKLGGGTSVTVLSNANGFADAVFTLGTDTGYSTHAVKASIPTDPNGTSGTKDGVTFTASAFAPADASQTRFRGRVVDEDEKPVEGVVIRFPDLGKAAVEAVTGKDGTFTYNGAPAGYAILEVDGSAATPLAGQQGFPKLTFEVHNVPGILNELDRPIFMLRLNKGKFVNGLTDVTITVDELPGFELKIPAGTKVTFPNGKNEGVVSVTQVHFDQAPMAPIDGLQSRILVTIQPPGVHFDPPAPLTIPNVDNYPPAKKVEMFSYDHDLESFVSIGTGTVSEDGSLLRTDLGVGIVKGGWHCGADPQNSGHCEKCPKPSASASVSGMSFEGGGNAPPKGTATISASGGPSKDTSWQFDVKCGNFSLSEVDSCAGQSSCKAKIVGGKSLRGRVGVIHKCVNTGETAETTVDVNLCEIPGVDDQKFKLSFGKDSDGNTTKGAAIGALFLSAINKAKGPVEAVLGCKPDVGFDISGSLEAQQTCCSGCDGKVAMEGGGGFSANIFTKMECAIPGLSVPFVKKLGIELGLFGELELGANLSGSIKGSGCCNNPPCVCTSGSGSASIDGAVTLKLVVDGAPSSDPDSSIVTVQGGVGTGVGLNATLSCKHYCLEGCFKGLKLEWKVAFANGFFGAKGEHYMTCPKSLGGGCSEHSLNELLPIGETGSCTKSTDVCGNPEPSSEDKEKFDKPTISSCGTPKGCEPDTCTPQCGGKECGKDLCGGVCGTCTEDQDCIEGKCEAKAP